MAPGFLYISPRNLAQAEPTNEEQDDEDEPVGTGEGQLKWDEDGWSLLLARGLHSLEECKRITTLHHHELS